MARIISEIRERVQVELSSPGDPEEERYRLLQAVTGFLRNASNVQPLLIVLEDLHDADRGTLDMLIHVARNLSGARLLIVGTYRDVEVDRAHPLSGALAELRRVSTFGRVPLRGLTTDEVHRMLEAMAGHDVLWSTAEAVHRQTEGNPLFIQEVLRYLVEEGLVKQEGGRWRSTRDTPVVMNIPEGLRDVIGKRLTRLGEACNRALAVAAVVGRDFRLDVLQKVAGISEEELFAALEEAKGVGVLEERTSVGAGVSYRFAHAFFRQTLYEETIAPRRIRLHQGVARALEEVYGRRLEEHAPELAEHFSYSSDPGDLEKAVHYGEVAAQRAMAVFAYGEAARHLEQCLQVQEVLDPDDRAKRCDLLLALGAAMMPAGEPRRMVDTVAPEALALAEALGDGTQAFRACQEALEGLRRYAPTVIIRSEEYRRWAELAGRYAQPGTVQQFVADVHLARVADVMGIRKDALSRLRNALDLARELGDPEVLFDAARNLFTLLRTPRDWDERVRLAQEFSTRPREGVSARTLAFSLIHCGTILLSSGQRARAEELLRELQGLGERTRDGNAILLALGLGAFFAGVDGRLEDSDSIRENLASRSEELGMPGFGFGGLGSDTRILLYRGRFAEALEGIGSAARAVDVGEAPVDIAQRALILAHLGQATEAQEILARLLASRAPEDEELDLGTAAAAFLLEVAVLIGSAEAATPLAQYLQAAPSALIVPGFMGCVARHLGEAAALLGEPDKARAYYLQALEACEKISFRPEIALTRLELAELLLEHYPDERAEALEHLDFAIGEFRDMKMQPSLERALRHREVLGA